MATHLAVILPEATLAPPPRTPLRRDVHHCLTLFFLIIYFLIFGCGVLLRRRGWCWPRVPCKSTRPARCWSRDGRPATSSSHPPRPPPPPSPTTSAKEVRTLPPPNLLPSSPAPVSRRVQLRSGGVTVVLFVFHSTHLQPTFLRWWLSGVKMERPRV